ncbi:D-alanyl-D-alanine carboxypeptidase [Lapidilactobacillus luobeiensis]|uniref:D-alanyl-D-alanine carboxypeptidase n=1 Tax=Lapidilactobacillus luobeiensis TaxID=2950371 RepID=UPI0021C431D8|nr:D-alanyl-D-alanine carboxypeptidase [Lapidilactobacillus luobeiensis]
MKNKGRHFFLVLTMALGLVLGIDQVRQQNVVAASSTIESPQTDIAAKAGLAVEVDSGQILAAKNIDTVMPIASLTKMLSLYLVLQAVDQGKLTWNQSVTPTEQEVTLSKNMELSNIPFVGGQSYTVKELFEAGWVYSANAAVMALGDAVSGDQTKFVDAMKAQLKKWGARDYQIVNASGLNNSFLGAARYPDSGADAENQMRARDLAIVAQHLVTDYPEVLKTTALTALPFHGTTYPTWDLLLPGQSAADADLPVDGLKTGTSDLAGECFVGTVKKNGFRIITVVLNASGNSDDLKKRFTATADLMKEVYANWHLVNVFTAKKSSPLLPAQKVTDGKKSQVKVVPSQTVKMLLPKSVSAKQLSLKVEKSKYSQVAAIAKGDQMGSVTMPIVGSGHLTLEQDQNVAVLAAENVEALNWLEKIWRNITNLFK